MGKKHAMSTYMEKLCKTVYKDLSKITSHFTYAYCDSIEDDNCDHDLPVKYPLEGYTDFDDGPDRYLLCKSYFIMSPNQILKLYIIHFLKTNVHKIIAQISIVNASIVLDLAEVGSHILFELRQDPK